MAVASTPTPVTQKKSSDTVFWIEFAAIVLAVIGAFVLFLYILAKTNAGSQ